MKILKIGDAENVTLGLQEEIRRSEESRYDHRLHGVLLVAQGLNCCQVADLLGDAPRTVAYWVERFEEDGLAGLQEGARSGRPSKLKPDQMADLQRVVRGKPSEVGLSGNLWDGEDHVGLPARKAPFGAWPAAMPALVAPVGVSLPEASSGNRACRPSETGGA